MTDTNRRDFLERLATGTGIGLGLGIAGCTNRDQQTPANAGAAGKPGRKRLRAAFSNVGLQSTWCALGKTTAVLWGELLDIEIEWFDGELKSEMQRNRIDAIVHKDWDFCCFQACQIDALAAPVRKLKQRGIPVISMDTELVEMSKMRDTGVWCQVTPNHVEMAEKSVGYLMQKIGGKGKIIHIGGDSAHSGARGRRDGCENILKNFSEVSVVGGEVRWCDWLKEKARNTFEALLAQEKEPIAGAFFHSDDMALASAPAIKGTIHKDMQIVAVDGQKEGLEAVQNGVLAATTVNPVCRIHRTSLFIGQFIARNGEKVDTVPMEVITPGPLCSKDHPNDLAAMFYLADPTHCIV